MKSHLIDASSLMLLMKKADIHTELDHLKSSYLLDLTFYEVGNAIWKDTCLTKFLTKSETETLQNRIQTILEKTDRITSEASNFQKILDISESERLSFYDSSYLFAAREKGLALVTEDKELSAKAEKHIKVQNVATLLH
ncbi:MAG TPA: type II toxin-antitoxin system VapC family toxin [Verrucomicrobiae bacterium]|nr:type II toxin-antitoxin system VapC family toxin [Verrucomicrobiae bacterium]